MPTQSSSDIKARARPATSLALRGMDPALRSALEAEAAKRGTSLNAAVLGILRDALGLTAAPGLYHDLDVFASTWSREEAEEFARATAPFEDIDPSLWTPSPELP